MDASMHERPRVLIFSTAYLPLIGGSELAIRNLTERMPDWDFDLVTGRYSADTPISEVMGRVRVFRAGGRLARLTVFLPKSLLPIPMALTAWRLARGRGYQLIHAYQASQAAGAAWIFKLFHPRTPFLLTLQEGKNLKDQSWLLRFFRGFIFRGASHITAISSHLADYVRMYTKTPVELIPNGVDTAAFSPGGARQPEHALISVSRLVPKNGVEYIIRAMPQIRDRFPDARLVLVGNGGLRSSLQKLARDEGVGDAVDFVGLISHHALPQYLRSADVFVRPSLSEGLGTAFLEAMSTGLPIVAPLRGGIVDFLRDGETGLVCDPTSPDDIARQVIRLFEDESLRHRLIGNGRILVERDYSWDHIARLMDSLYLKIITLAR